jgi:hypothetical protein
MDVHGTKLARTLFTIYAQSLKQKRPSEPDRALHRSDNQAHEHACFAQRNEDSVNRR